MKGAASSAPRSLNGSIGISHSRPCTQEVSVVPSSSIVGIKRDIFIDTKDFVEKTSAHRDSFKAFVNTYGGILSATEQFVRAIAKVGDSRPGVPNQAGSWLVNLAHSISRSFLESFSQKILDELRNAKSGMKDKLESILEESKNQQRELSLISTSLEKTVSAMNKTEKDIKKIQSRLQNNSENIRATDKNSLFSQLKKLQSDKDRLSTESIATSDRLQEKHGAVYRLLVERANEMASMRRRADRRVIAELQKISEQISTSLIRTCGDANRQSVAVDSLLIHYPQSGDYGMHVCPLERSAETLIGSLVTLPGGVEGVDRNKNVSVLEWRAIETYYPKEQGEVGFRRGEQVHVIKKESVGWWYGRNEAGNVGLFPSSFVVERPVGVPLPPPMAESFHPNVAQSRFDSTWRIPEAVSPGQQPVDMRLEFLKAEGPGKVTAICQFGRIGYAANGELTVEPHERVIPLRVINNDTIYCRRTSHPYLEGTVPLAILSISRMLN